MQIEATGKSVEIAIQNGLLECGMKREDVDVKIVEKGGLFKKAKVILLAILYGMGAKSLANSLKVSIEEAKQICDDKGIDVYNIIKSTESIVMDSLSSEDTQNIEKLEVANG